MTSVGRLPDTIVLFQTDEGSNEPYGITLGILSSLNSSRTCTECAFHIIVLLSNNSIIMHACTLKLVT